MVYPKWGTSKIVKYFGNFSTGRIPLSVTDQIERKYTSKGSISLSQNLLLLTLGNFFFFGFWVVFRSFY